MDEEEYELAIAGLLAMIDVKNARIAKLESALRSEAAIQETQKDKHISYLEANFLTIQQYIDAQSARIAELETQLAAANAEIATLASLALDASNIFSYSEPDTATQLANCG